MNHWNHQYLSSYDTAVIVGHSLFTMTPYLQIHNYRSPEKQQFAIFYKISKVLPF